MKELKFSTNKGKFLLVDCPVEAKHITLAKDNRGLNLCWHDGNANLINDNFSHGQIEISNNPTNSFTLLGTVKDMTEEQFAEVVDSRIKGGGLLSYPKERCFKDYINRWYAHKITAFYSFKTLVRSLGLYLWENPDCPNQFCDNGYVDLGYNEKVRCLLCEEVEERVFENPILLKKI